MTCDLPEQSMALPNDPTSARTARRFLDETTCDIHDSRVSEDAQLMASELVGNAVRHGAPPVVIALRCVGHAALEVRVSDAGPDRPEARDLADAAAEGGRGMALVDLLSDAWGVEEDPGEGKAVWFRLNL